MDMTWRLFRANVHAALCAKEIAQYAITILIKTYILHVLNLRLLENILYIRYYILNRKHYTYVLIINNAYKYAKQMKYNY